MKPLSRRGRSGLSQEEGRETEVPTRERNQQQAGCFTPPCPGKGPHGVTAHMKGEVGCCRQTIPGTRPAGAPGERWGNRRRQAPRSGMPVGVGSSVGWKIRSEEKGSRWKNEALLTHATTWMNLEDTTQPSETKTRHKGTNTIWFHLQELPRVVKFTQTESKIEIIRGWRVGQQGVID